jgi:hypothetical protein
VELEPTTPVPARRSRRPAPRFLARRPRSVPDADSPETRAEAERVAEACVLIDEPECVGPAIADQFGTHAAFIREQQHLANLAPVLEVRATLSVEQRVAGCVSRAKRAHVGIGLELRAIRGGLDEARLKGRLPKPAVLRELERLEALLDSLC